MKFELFTDLPDPDSIIREMQAADYGEAYELWSRTPGMGLNEADSYENIVKFLQRNKGLSFICMVAGRVVGTILSGHDGRRGYIYHAVVAQEYRGKGIGRALAARSLQKLREEGIGKCHLFVFVDNERGKAFWTATGWKKRDDLYIYSREP